MVQVPISSSIGLGSSIIVSDEADCFCLSTLTISMDTTWSALGVGNDTAEADISGSYLTRNGFDDAFTLCFQFLQTILFVLCSMMLSFFHKIQL